MSGGEQQQINTIREAVQAWKLRELEKNTAQGSPARGLKPLHAYLANAAQLRYDLTNYVNGKSVTEKNRQDPLVQAITQGIGSLDSLSYPQRTLILRLFERDLHEFPFTPDPRVVNVYTKKGLPQANEISEEE